MKDNLWLCVTCGFVGCGRRQFDGSGGNGHAADHFQSSGHAVSLKLGTIDSDGSADIFCYACDEMRVDLDLKKHLSLFGIEVIDAERTSKSMAELQLEHNLKYDFNMISENGREFEMALGLGLRNLGNSCYMASILQACFGLEKFSSSFSDPAHFAVCSKDPWACLQCQLTKLQDAYDSSFDKEPLNVSPWMFKGVVASGHSEFSSGQQQDAAEYFIHFLKMIQRNDKRSLSLASFNMKTQQTIRCIHCSSMKCRSQEELLIQVPLASCVNSGTDLLDPKLSLGQCLEKAFEANEVEVNCYSCQNPISVKELYITKLPEVLVLPVSRYVIDNWVPKKLDVAIDIPFVLDMASFVRDSLPETDDQELRNEENFEVNEEALQQLISMGFSKRKASKAIQVTGNSGADLAMNWLFENMDEPDGESVTVGTEIPEDMIETLLSAGFSRGASVKALECCDLDVERAFDYILNNPGLDDEPAKDIIPIASSDDSFNRSTIYELVAFVSHNGPSIHCGHYVTYRKTDDGRWILCNDSKLAIVPDGLIEEAAKKSYILFYKQC